MTTDSPLDALDFSDLTPRVVTIKNLFGHNYTLREATGDAEIKFRDAVLACTQVVDDKVLRTTGVEETTLLLLSLCLYDENNQLVPAETIRTWPARVKDTLIDRVKEISEIDQPDVIFLEKHIAKMQEKLARLKERHPN